MKKGLVFITGISDRPYGIEQICQQKEFWRKIVNKYGREHIHEINYQDIMDKYAFAFKSLLDPVRLVMMPKGWRAERFVAQELIRLSSIYEELDVITHSLGSWIVLKANVKVHNLYLIASPIGWTLPAGRTFVQLNIGNPRIVADNLFYIYSDSDFISKYPPVIEGKWTLKADNVRVINTKTVHDLRKYIIALNSRYPEIFK